MNYGMTLTARESTMLLGILDDLLRKPYNEINQWLGSETIVDMATLAHKMRYNDYCIEHDKHYEDLTEDDFLSDYYDRYEE